MPNPRASRKRENQQISRAAVNGHNRLCPHCLRMISTTRGRFNKHGSTDGPKFECTGSGQKVGKP